MVLLITIEILKPSTTLRDNDPQPCATTMRFQNCQTCLIMLFVFCFLCCNVNYVPKSTEICRPCHHVFISFLLWCHKFSFFMSLSCLLEVLILLESCDLSQKKSRALPLVLTRPCVDDNVFMFKMKFGVILNVVSINQNTSDVTLRSEFAFNTLDSPLVVDSLGNPLHYASPVRKVF